MNMSLSKTIIKSIRKVTGKGKQQLHEPLFCGNEIKYLKRTISTNSVSSIGDYVKKFEEKIKNITKSKFAIAVINGTTALHISLKVSGVKNNDYGVWGGIYLSAGSIDKSKNIHNMRIYLINTYDPNYKNLDNNKKLQFIIVE